MRANILLLLLMMALACFFTGCGEKDTTDSGELDEEITSDDNGDDEGDEGKTADMPAVAVDSPALKGKDASEYERILDFDHVMDNFGPDAFGDEMGVEGKNIFDAVMDVTGIDDLEQANLEAKKDGDMVSIRSFIKYDGNDAETLAALMTKWQPATADTIKGIQRDDLWGMLAFGNVPGYLDTILEWATGTDAIDTILNSLPEDEVDSETRASIGLGKMMAKGFWMEAQEEYYPYFGDEVILALFENDDFRGFDVYAMPDNFTDVMPIRFLIAFETRKEGLTQLIFDTMEENRELLESFAYKMTYDEEAAKDFWDIKTESKGDYEINYLDIDADGVAVQVGWTEYENTFIISDLDTLENLNDYYNPSKRESGYPAAYCSYAYLNIDKPLQLVPGDLSEMLHQGIEGMKTNMEWQNENDPDSPYTQQMNEKTGANIKAAEDILAIITDTSSFGAMAAVSFPKNNGFETTITCTEPVADIWLILLDLMESEIESSMY